MNADPFRFAWPVDQDGYKIWVNRHDSETALRVGRNETVFIQPRGGPLRYYYPLGFEGLWLRFAESCKSVEGALSFANEFGLPLTLESELPGAGDEVSDFLREAELLRKIAERLDAGDRVSATKLLNEGGGAHVTEAILPNEKTAAFEVVLIPTTLLSALLHQAAEAIGGDRRFRRCRNEGCPNWFRVGPQAHTARREFCSDRCRVASARRQKREKLSHA
jgi:hypothetical protein